jgi:hypothetical protein
MLIRTPEENGTARFFHWMMEDSTNVFYRMQKCATKDKRGLYFAFIYLFFFCNFTIQNIYISKRIEAD